MARTASVSEIDIFTAIKIIAERTGAELTGPKGPSKYAIRKYLMEAKPGEAMPSYGLIEKALRELSQLLAAGNVIDDLINAEALARAVTEADIDIDAAERLTNYLSEILRPIAKKLIDDAHAAASNRELELGIRLDEALRERDEYQQSAQVLNDQLLENTSQLNGIKIDLQAADIKNEILESNIAAQSEQVEILKTIAAHDREALEREREHHRNALHELSNAATQREHELNHQLKLSREANAALQNTVSTLSADKTALFDKHRAEIQQREALQSICNEQLTAINAAEQWRKELLAMVDELRAKANAQEQALRTLQRSESEYRNHAETLEQEYAAVQDRVTQLAGIEAELKIQLREKDVIAQSRIRELEGITAVLREALATREMSTTYSEQKKLDA